MELLTEPAGEAGADMGKKEEAMTVTETDKACPLKQLRPLVAVIVILVGMTIICAVLYPPTSGSGVKASRTKVKATPPRASQVALVPPWHSKPQLPDSVTGATPKRMSFNRAIVIVSPSVVGINTSGAESRSGSGVIVSSKGYILTNHHVVEGAKNIVVTLVRDQVIKSYSAKVVATKPEVDLALLKIVPDGKEVLTPAPLGNSDRVVIGEDVVVIGSPFGLAQSASAGIISNNRRTLTAGKRVFKDLLQTDASINPGSSGGALVNTKAEVIGINIAIYSPVRAFTGIGFAIPINQAKAAFSEFIQIVRSPLAGVNAVVVDGNLWQSPLPASANLQMIAMNTGVSKAWVGIDVDTVGAAVERQFNLPFRGGVLINRVFDNSPAAKAGVMRGDVVFRVDNRRIKDEKMLWSSLVGHIPGDLIRISLFRDGRKKILPVRLAPEPGDIRALLSRAPLGAAAGAAGAAGIEEISWMGIDIQPVTDLEAMQEFGIPPTAQGVLVGEVEGIAAIEAGLAPGDLIRKINTHQVTGIQSFKEIIKQVDTSEGVVLDILRQKRPFYITIKPVARNLGAWQ